MLGGDRADRAAARAHHQRVGGGAAGIGAAGAAKQTDPQAEVTVYTEFEDVGYSPCGIPYVHGREIPTFEQLFLATKETYEEAGIDIHYETKVTRLDPERRTIEVEGEGTVAYDALVIAKKLGMRSLESRITDAQREALESDRDA